MRIAQCFWVLGLAWLVTGCASARLVERTPDGGILALRGDRQKAMLKAEAEMSAQCGPNRYTILKEGEEVIGTDTYGSSETRQTRRGKVVSNSGASTRDAVEWRVYYQCNGGQAVAAAAEPQNPYPSPQQQYPQQPYPQQQYQQPQAQQPYPQQPYPQQQYQQPQAQQPYPQQPYPAQAPAQQRQYPQPGPRAQQPYPNQPQPQYPAPSYPVQPAAPAR
jgi:hypothetical protein